MSEWRFKFLFRPPDSVLDFTGQFQPPSQLLQQHSSCKQCVNRHAGHDTVPVKFYLQKCSEGQLQLLGHSAITQGLHKAVRVSFTLWATVQLQGLHGFIWFFQMVFLLTLNLETGRQAANAAAAIAQQGRLIFYFLISENQTIWAQHNNW